MRLVINLLIVLTTTLRLPFDTWMDKYPEWNDKWSPILLKCEPTHFYGYFETPSRKIKAVWSDSPVDSWYLEYNLGYQEPAPYWFMGHRIKGAFLEGARSKIHYIDCPSTDSVMSLIHKDSGLPMADIPRTSYSKGETAEFYVYGKNPVVRITDPSGKRLQVRVKKKATESFKIKCRLRGRGLYKVQIRDGEYIATATLTVHRNWEDCMRIARSAAIRYRQQPSSQVESWYGYYSAFLAARHFPEAKPDTLLNRRFGTFLTTMYSDSMVPKYYEWRIQNTAGTIGMLVDRYQAYGNVSDLQRASKMADWLINYSQSPSGAYMNGKTVYTSVIYTAKSILELYLAEKDLMPEAAARHYESARRAIDQLVAADGNYQTEGEQTFEDGMISCSALQMGMFALLQEDPGLRGHYTKAMLKVLDSHECLTQLVVPDARRRGGTMRFWEAQYDVLMLPNMISSPHGWSAWRAYATWYAWLLTGEERWLRESWNAMGAFAGLISAEGKLRWAYVVDPHIKARQLRKPVSGFNPDSLDLGDKHPDRYGAEPVSAGEQYVDMIGDFQTVHCCENDVHEIFKFLEESFLTRASVAIGADGIPRGYNCRIFRLGRHLWVKPAEKQVRELYAHVPGFKVHFKGTINHI